MCLDQQTHTPARTRIHSLLCLPTPTHTQPPAQPDDITAAAAAAAEWWGIRAALEIHGRTAAAVNDKCFGKGREWKRMGVKRRGVVVVMCLGGFMRGEERAARKKM